MKAIQLTTILSAMLGFTLTALPANAMNHTGNSHDHPKEGYYATLGIGLSMLNKNDFDTGGGGVSIVDTEYEDGYGFNGSVGYIWGSYRTEVEIAYRQDEVENHKVSGTALAGPDGDATSLAVMLNGFYDFHSENAFTPYVGIGIGFADVELDGFGVTAVPQVVDDGETVFAYQFIAGLNYYLNESTSVILDYRYFATDDVDVRTTLGSNNTSVDYDTHSLMLGLRYDF